jgi:YfiH family protein
LSLVFFTTGRRQGNARVPGALSRILKSKRLPATAATAEQVHGVRLKIVSRLHHPQTFPGADGLLTDVADQPLAIFTADCVPIFLSADNGRIVGALHAGWRGVRGGILKKAVRLLWKKWRSPARRLQIWTGPSIGACCFEVQWDVARYFPSTRFRRNQRWRVDLVGELRRQAERLGVRWIGKKASGGCTMHGVGSYSYRRDKTDKRQASIILKGT